MSERSRFLVGIDLGTTNCALAYVDTKGKERPSADLKVFEIPQLVAPGESAPRSMLPSFLYLPGTLELPPEAARLPWTPPEGPIPSRIVGEFARIQGARVPSRLVGSAKSWLCHAGVDREDPILPWGAPSEVPKVSPVEASAEYLRHLRDAWNARFAPHAQDTSARLEHQEIVLTVPASFDEAARELTLKAARAAGLERVVLLEEPQAAFYCWIVSHQEGWQRQLRAGEVILVIDVGGGTTDFSLITVVETPEGPGFRRVAVGDHLMLGGDNIDLALAHHVEQGWGHVRLDADQWSALRAACRTAKEKLLADDPPESWPVTIAGRGSKVIGGSLQGRLCREEVVRLVVDGYFPLTPRDELPERGGRSALVEFGLPYVADPALSRHLAAFLKRHAHDTKRDEDRDRGMVRPDAVLFNGGALTPAILRERLGELLASWFDQPCRVLTNDSLDLAVALGAAYRGVVRRGGGIRIGGGTARGFYLGLASGETPSPSGSNPATWMCVVPRDAQEGDEIAIKGRDFELVVGRPVAFPLAGSSVRAGDKPGDLLPHDPDTLSPLPPLTSLMKVGRKAKAETVRVSLGARVTEIGTVELWCRSRDDDRRWDLQIQIRSANRVVSSVDGVSQSDHVVLEKAVLDQAARAVRDAFAPHSDPDAASRLVKRLEEIFESPRDQWPISALRSLWDPLREVMDRRGLTPRHEGRWCNLAGFALRPGTGFPLDEARVKALWPLFHQGPKHPKDQTVWNEWWVMWRRVAAGLNRRQQDEFHRKVAPLVLPAKPGAAGARKLGRAKPEGQEAVELWRCLASLERLAPSQKETLGEVLIRDLARPKPGPASLWALGRLGARNLVAGPANAVVPPTVAARWLAPLLNREPTDPRDCPALALTIAWLIQFTGDRARDLEPDLRDRGRAALERLGCAPELIDAVQRPPHDDIDRTRAAAVLGDSLPIGLRLTRAAEFESEPEPEEPPS